MTKPDPVAQENPVNLGPDETSASDEVADARSFPGARRPDRMTRVDSHGIGLSVIEWGDADAPPLLLAHGGFDFAGTYDCFAPLLADAGWRVVSWDQRGHGNSDHSPLYTWDADVRDMAAVLNHVTDRPIPLLGHSKGGGLVLQVADALPHRVSAVINLDGVPSFRTVPDINDRNRSRTMSEDMSSWLDHRRGSATRPRKPDTLDGLAQRRRRMNPRLPIEWLRYLVTVGARHDEDGWRWKLDPSMRFGGFGPWRPQWSVARMAGLSVPFLGIIGMEAEEMGWGTTADDVDGILPDGAEFHAIDTGHFVHIEKPRPVADLTLDFLERRIGGPGGQP
ncbi:MAG: pimeloyl-ACP methyl ester carboxylesterase [Candidatus Poriferisodalaceae bacterium]|jgi:pimeloyl-ACP methyl ester carboxylesterase